MLSKQVVTGSNPVSRSSRLTRQPASPSFLGIERQLSTYRLDARSEGYSEETIAHVELAVRLFTEFLGGIEDVSLVDGDDLTRFIVCLKDKTPHNYKSPGGRKLSPVTVNTYIRAIRSFWGWLKRRRAIPNNPMAEVPAPRFPKKVARIYSDDLLKKLLKHVVGKPRERAIIELFMDSGIRLSELSGLHVEDLDLDQGSVRVMGKGSKERYSYFSPNTALVLNDYIAKRPLPRGENYLFLTAAGDQLSGSGIQTTLGRIGELLDFPVRLSPHNLRHTYTTLCLKNGSNLEYIRITRGHTDIKTTSDAYLAATQGDVALAYRKFSPMSNMNKKRK